MNFSYILTAYTITSIYNKDLKVKDGKNNNKPVSEWGKNSYMDPLKNIEKKQIYEKMFNIIIHYGNTN